MSFWKKVMRRRDATAIRRADDDEFKPQRSLALSCRGATVNPMTSGVRTLAHVTNTSLGKRWAICARTPGRL